MKGDSFFAFLGGVILGATAAILFAPESGTETRKKIKDSFDKECQNLKDKYQDIKERGKAAAEAAEEEMN